MKVAQDADEVSGDGRRFLLLHTSLGDDAIKHGQAGTVVKDHVYLELISDGLVQFDDVRMIQIAEELHFALYQRQAFLAEGPPLEHGSSFDLAILVLNVLFAAVCFCQPVDLYISPILFDVLGSLDDCFANFVEVATADDCVLQVVKLIEVLFENSGTRNHR